MPYFACLCRRRSTLLVLERQERTKGAFARVTCVCARVKLINACCMPLMGCFFAPREKRLELSSIKFCSICCPSKLRPRPLPPTSRITRMPHAQRSKHAHLSPCGTISSAFSAKKGRMSRSSTVGMSEGERRGGMHEEAARMRIA